VAGSSATGTNEIFFVEDEELDFETILSAPLPKVPLDVTYTGNVSWQGKRGGHCLAIAVRCLILTVYTFSSLACN